MLDIVLKVFCYLMYQKIALARFILTPPPMPKTTSILFSRQSCTPSLTLLKRGSFPDLRIVSSKFSFLIHFLIFQGVHLK